MRRLPLLALVSAAMLSPRADGNILIGGAGTINVTGQISTTTDPSVPTFPGTLVTTGGTLSGVTVGGLYFGTNLLPVGCELFPAPPTVNLGSDGEWSPYHPDYQEDYVGGIDDLLADVDDLDSSDFEPFVVDERGNIIDDPTIPSIYPPYIPELGFIGTDVSDDGRVTLGFDQVSGNWQLRFADSDEPRPLPMVSFSDLLEEGEVGPTVMLTLAANGLSGDGSTVIGSHPAGSSFRYRGDGRDSLELLGNGAEAGFDSTWAAQLSFNGDIVVGQARKASTGLWQAARWDASGQLSILNPLDDSTNSVAKLVTPDGSVVAGDVAAAAEGRIGVVPFVWSEAKGFRQLGDPNASDDQVIVQTLSDDGLVLGGHRANADGSRGSWFWTEEDGFQDIILVVCDGPFGNPTENYTLTGVDLERSIFMGNLQDGRQFLSFDGVTVLTADWMESLEGPISTLNSAMALASQTMEGAHHRPIKSLAFPGRNEFAWATGDLGKATRQRDAQQSAGEFGYGMRIGADAVLGLAFGYSELDQDFDATGSGQTTGVFAVADLGFSAGPGEVTLTAMLARSDVETTRDGSVGQTDGRSLSLRARYDQPVAKLGAVPVAAFAALTYDHSSLDAYAETGGVAPASIDAQSKDNWVGRIGVTGKLGLGKETDLHLTAEAVRLLSDNQDSFSGTDLATGVLDFAMPDVRAKRTWGRLGLDLDHRLAPDTVLSLTLHASTEGDAFDTAAALSIRKGF